MAMNKLNILCLIPARSGSKGIKHKNIKEICGKPLISWTIEQAKMFKEKIENDDRWSATVEILVSTDSIEYIEIAKKYGGENICPFIRPKNISDDSSTDIEFIKHALEYYDNVNRNKPDLIIQLRPTQPCRKVSDIINCFEKFIKYIPEGATSLRTVVLSKKSPYKMYKISESGKKLEPLFITTTGIGGDIIKEPFNECRQSLSYIYLHNGYIDIFKTSIVLDYNSISGDHIIPYIMDENDTIDIDDLDDWTRAEEFLIQLSPR